MTRARVREPDQRIERMPHYQRASSAPRFNAVHIHGAFQGAQIQFAPVAHRVAEHASGVEEVIGYQRRRAKRAVVCVAIIHDLQRSHYSAHRIGRPFAVYRKADRREVAHKLHGDLALNPQPYEAGARNRGCAVQYGFLEYHACAGIRNTEETLHDRGRAANLISGLRPHSGDCEQCVERALQRVSLRFGLRAHFSRHIDDRRQRQSLIQKPGCCRKHLHGLHDCSALSAIGFDAGSIASPGMPER